MLQAKPCGLFRSHLNNIQPKTVVHHNKRFCACGALWSAAACADLYKSKWLFVICEWLFVIY
jgi:hypothetical protein